MVSRPAELLGRASRPIGSSISSRSARPRNSVKDAGALPLLSYTLDDMWRAMLKAGDGVLRIPVQSVRAWSRAGGARQSFLAEHPAGEDALRRVSP